MKTNITITTNPEYFLNLCKTAGYIYNTELAKIKKDDKTFEKMDTTLINKWSSKEIRKMARNNPNGKYVKSYPVPFKTGSADICRKNKLHVVVGKIDEYVETEPCKSVEKITVYPDRLVIEIETIEYHAGIDLGMDCPVALTSETGSMVIKDKMYQKYCKTLSDCKKSGDVKELVEAKHNVEKLASEIADETFRWCKKHHITKIVVGEHYGDHPLAPICNQFIKRVDESVNMALVKEDFTSKISFIDKDKLNATKYSGSRITRDTYCTKDGHKVHADLNGAGNICRMVYPDFDAPLKVLQNPEKINLCH